MGWLGKSAKFSFLTIQRNSDMLWVIHINSIWINKCNTWYIFLEKKIIEEKKFAPKIIKKFTSVIASQN